MHYIIKDLFVDNPFQFYNFYIKHHHLSQTKMPIHYSWAQLINLLWDFDKYGLATYISKTDL